MDTEIILFPGNLDEEIDLLWSAVCQILRFEPDAIKKPAVRWEPDQVIDLAERGARFAALGPDKRTIFLSSETLVYRGHLAHEMAHYLRWHLAGYDDSEYWPVKVDEEIGRI
jgi:hypothetical protein